MALEQLRPGEVEQLVLLAVLRLEVQAYAVPIRALIHRDASVQLSRGSIYIRLDRLAKMGLVESWFSEPTGEPGGKARRLFSSPAPGVAALKAARRAVDRLSAGTALQRR